MKHIERDFSFKAWVQSSEMYLGGKVEAKIKLFWNMVMLHIKLKPNNACSNMVENILPTDTTSTPGVVSKGQTTFFF